MNNKAARQGCSVRSSLTETDKNAVALPCLMISLFLIAK